MNITAATVRHILAAEMRPGDVVLDPGGIRRHGAFDVDTDACAPHAAGAPAEPRVRVWTTIADQEAGQPATIEYHPADRLVVKRRNGAPAVTHTTIVVPFDDRPFPYTAR